ncbi:unnamed protein product [Heligmosomoides polygyrus]|uniref:Methyltransf_11 domain-containing protein n=1 Tax=Heligmosomoides polygyrus TaxID=6339 RepID=A0A183GKP4_HELPZ|nr:unnamed protein product [Heligmosomoides polygyrus]
MYIQDSGQPLPKPPPSVWVPGSENRGFRGAVGTKGPIENFILNVISKVRHSYIHTHTNINNVNQKHYIVKTTATTYLAHQLNNILLMRTFSHQTKLFWLDLSKNQLSSFEDGTFDAKIANIFLDGHPLFCDDEFDWFLWCSVTSRVRTFLPYQSEITCAGPKKYVGVRLKDLMIRKANDTLTEGMKTLAGPMVALIPGLRGAPTG